MSVGLYLSTALFACFTLWRKSRTLLQILCLFYPFQMILNLAAASIVILRTSMLKLRVPLCDDPYDCPIVLNTTMVHGIVIGAVSVVGICLQIFFLSGYISLYRYIQVDYMINLQRQSIDTIGLWWIWSSTSNQDLFRETVSIFTCLDRWPPMSFGSTC